MLSMSWGERRRQRSGDHERLTISPSSPKPDNPTDIVAGNQHWGHATSRDLYTWTNQPIAIFPDKAGDGIFTGSCVLDPDNTSGFFPDTSTGVVAIYTLNNATEETQELAYSTDEGISWTKYAGNPVLGIGSTQFRDPKVIWHAPTQKWIMAVARAQSFIISFYASPDLIDWTPLSNFSHHGLLGLQYEVPNLVRVPNADTGESMYVLTISINPGAPLGGSITQYFPGSFDGTTFTPVDAATRILDFGKDDYAGQFFYGTPEGQPAVAMAWASNWQYSQRVPTGELEGFRSFMGAPQQLVVRNATRIGYDLVAQPYDLSPLYTNGGAPLYMNASFVNTSTSLNYSALVPSGALYLDASFAGLPQENLTGTINVTFTAGGSGEKVELGQFLAGDQHFFFNRDKVHGFDNPFFTGKTSTTLVTNGTFRLQALIDRAILEVYLQGGEKLGTNTFFPQSPFDCVTVAVEGVNEGVMGSVAIWGLKSGWEMAGNPTGKMSSMMSRRERRSSFRRDLDA